MRLGKSTQSPAEELLAADAALSETSNESADIAPCHKRYTPAHLLAWKVSELGGGVSHSQKRDPVVLEGLAAVIAGLGLENAVVVLTDVRWGRKLQVKTGELEDGRTYVYYEDATADTGKAEVDAILAKVRETDAAGGWQSWVPTDTDGAVLYDAGSTAAVLYRTGAGLALAAKGVSRVWDEPVDGIGGLLAWATFDVPAGDDTEAWQVSVAAPLNVRADDALAAPDEPGEADLSDLPDGYVIALAAGDGTDAKFSGVRSRLGLSSRAQPAEGTVLDRPYWEELVETRELLIDNALAANPYDVRVQDASMSWQALAPPDHPDELAEIVGRVADQVLVKRGGDLPPRVAVLRVVDLVRAALAKESPVYSAATTETETTPSTGEADSDPPAGGLPEDGVLASPLARFRSTYEALAQSEEAEDEAGDEDSSETSSKDAFDPEAAADVSTCHEFVRRLSSHWPLLATLLPDV